MQRRRHFVGRASETGLFRQALDSRELPFALFYGYGPGGVGKSTLLREFAAMAEERGYLSFSIDCRFLAPTPEVFEQALCFATGQASPEAARELLGKVRTVLLLDTFEVLEPLEGWFRDTFLPSLPDTVLTAAMGRKRPSSAWKSDGAWLELARFVGLRNLSDEDSRRYLESQMVPGEQLDGLVEFTHGHPLALTLVCETLAQNGRAQFEPDANPDVINVLLDRFLDSVPGPLHRQALETTALLRNTTEAILAAVVGEEHAFELFEWLKTLSFIETGPFGIYPHDLARDAIAMELRWRNPDQFCLLHDRARAYYADHLERTTGLAQQIVLADYIYLHRDNPAVKPFFNWSQSRCYLDRARAEDLGAMLKIVERHEGSESGKIADMWISAQPEGAYVLRDSANGHVAGLLVTVDLAGADLAQIEKDPGAKAAWEHIARNAPLRSGEKALIFRFWMSEKGYQDVSPDQSLIFVSMVHQSLTTPSLAFTFQVCANADFYQPMFEYAASPRVVDGDFRVGRQAFGMFGHDWRAMPVKAWLALLSEREIPVAGGTPPPPPSEVMVLSQSSFETAVLQALKTFNNPARLAENPLLRSRVVVDQVGAEADTKMRMTALREAIFEQAKTLAVSSKERGLFRALETSYFQPARSQEVAAEKVDVSIATYRRHLKAGVRRVTELLWQAEIG